MGSDESEAMDPASAERIAESLQQLALAPGGLVERWVLLEALRSIEPSWTDENLSKILQAAGLPEDELISCADFTSWLFDVKSTSSSARPVPHITDDMTVEFLTDVEGNWEYFVHFISLSQVLFWSGEDRGVWGPGELQLRDSGYLVFGGDAVDKGAGDLRVVKTLLALKQRYGSRVFIVIGNRDICKLRFFAELQEGEDGGSFEKKGGAYWIPDPKPFPDYETYVQMHNLERGHISTVRWVLDCNMGCQTTTFNTRRHELALLGVKATDEAVVHSYRDSVDPASADPWMLELLRVGQMAVILGNALFVHGGIYDEALGQVPGQSPAANMSEWADRLNAWKDEQLRDFALHPKWRVEDGKDRRGGDRLIDYGSPGGANNTSIVYHNPFNNGNPQQLSNRVEDFLAKSGIRRVFSGHQPHGESPTVVRHVRSGLLVITADTSYSNMSALKLFNQANNRGEVVTNVRLRGDRVQLEGVLRDGSQHGCQLHCNPAQGKMPDALVGCQLNDGSWVKTVLEDGRVLAALGKRFQVSVQSMHPGKACLMLKSVYSAERLHVSLKNLSAEWLLESQKDVQLLPGPESGHEHPNDSWSNATQFKREEFDSAETYIFDGHGTLWGVRGAAQGVTNLDLEQQIISQVNSLIAAGKQVIFATNDSNYSRRMYVDRLLKHGIRLCNDDEVSREHAKQKVVTAAFTCAWFLKKALIRKPFVICSHVGLLEELREAGITDYVATIDNHGQAYNEYFAPVTKENVTRLVQQSKDVDAIVVGWDQQLTALKVAVAAAFLKWSRATEGQNVMQIVQCSSDHAGVLGVTSEDFLPSTWANQSIPAVGNGTMCQMVCASVGEDIQAIDVGKPSEVLIEALRRPVEEEGYGVELDKAVIVGDTLNTDIELAVRSGMRSLLVLSGVTSRSDLEKLRETTRFPTWVVESLAHI